MNTLELIQIAHADADAWNDMGRSSFAQEHGLTLGYHTDAEEVRAIIEKFEKHGDLDTFRDDLCDLDTIVRDAMFNTFEAIDELMDEYADRHYESIQWR